MAHWADMFDTGFGDDWEASDLAYDLTKEMVARTNVAIGAAWHLSDSLAIEAGNGVSTRYATPVGAKPVAKVKASSGFACMECGHRFRTLKGAERAMLGPNGCPKCGGSDVDLAAHRSAS